jgi:hypothetical protein
MRGLFGTDEACRQEHDQSQRMIDEAEAKVTRLHKALDDRPPRNLDEAVYGITHERER